MASIRELDVRLIDWEAKYVLESISREMQRLKAINETSTDEDEAADAGNDFIELSGLYERLLSEAINKFGAQIVES